MYVYVYSIRQETNKFVKLCNKSHLMKDPNCVSSISGDMLQEQLTHLCLPDIDFPSLPCLYSLLSLSLHRPNCPADVSNIGQYYSYSTSCD